MVFLGYEAGSKAYRLFDPRGGRVAVSCDVVFDEKVDRGSSGIGECKGGHGTFVVEHLVIHSGGGARQEEPVAGVTSPEVASPEGAALTETPALEGPASLPTMGAGEQSLATATQTPLLSPVPAEQRTLSVEPGPVRVYAKRCGWPHRRIPPK